MSLFEELKRRNVFRVAVAYLLAAWVLLQAIDFLLDAISAPNWIVQVFIIAAVAGFVAVLVFSWVFEMTPDGIRREKDIDRTQSITPHTGRKLDRVIIAFLAVAVVLLLADRFWNKESDSRAERAPTSSESAVGGAVESPAASAKSIAVLPFRDMSAAGDQAYFGEGIAEELLNALVKLDGLEVASRTSSFSIAAENLDIPTIAERLRVDNILEGSIRTSGQQVRVTAQLIDVHNDVHLWSETYDGTLEDIFEIQDEITLKIVAALKIHLGDQTLPASAQEMTNNPEAYRLYLQGRHLWRTRNRVALHQAIELFNQAVAQDPQFHQAWSNLGLAYINLPGYDPDFSDAESYERGVAAAEKALSIYPQSAEALMIKGTFLERIKCQYADAAVQYQKALAFAPEDPTAHHWYGILLGNVGQLRKALEEIQTARRLDPLISGAAGFEAQLEAVLGNFDRARELHGEAAALGMFGGSGFDTGFDYLLSGDVEKARPLLAEGRYPENVQHMAMLHSFLAALVDAQKWSAFEDLIGTDQRMSAGTTETVLELLAAVGSPYVFEYQAESDCPYIPPVFWSDAFREQRKTPEFFELMRRVGAVEYWQKFGWPDDCASMDQDLAECEKP